MRNRRTVLLGILFVLLFINIELSQPQSNTVLDQPTTSGNPTLSQSESVTIIQAIHAAELRTRDHIDQKYTELGTKISKIETKVTLLDKQVSDLKWWVIALTTLILLPLIFPGIRRAWQKWVVGDSTSGGDSPSLRLVKTLGTSGGFESELHPESEDLRRES